MNYKNKKTHTIILIILIIVFITACAPESNINPPDTSIEQMQPVYGKSGVKIILSGTDDKTPVEKLTYKYAFFVKDENDEEQLYFEGDTQTADLFIEAERFEEGEYIGRITAVNEFGLSDKTPAEGSFKVDLTPPEIPVIDYQIIAGEVLLNILNENDNDIAGYEMVLSNTTDSKAFSSTLNSFTFKATKGDHYEIAVLAYDNAGNNSEEAHLTIDTTVDEAPRLENRLPDFLGKNDDFIPIEFYDDWSKPSEITVQATFNGKNTELAEEGLDVDVSMMNEGTHTLNLTLKDKDDNVREIRKDIFIDLTPPQIPFDCGFKEQTDGYLLTWDSEVEEKETYRIYGFNKEEDTILLDTVEGKAFRTSERFLHYVITSVDKAGNESSPSYPIRTYNEKYLPITSSELGEIRENTLLTSLYSPYTIDNAVTIPSEILLGIEKGVALIFTENGSFDVKGHILSIPSKSSKERTIELNFQKPEAQGKHSPLIRISGGSVWLNESKIMGNDSPLTLFEVSNGGEFRAQGISVAGVDTVINSVDSDTIVLDDSVIEAVTFATGTSARAFRVSNSQFNVVDGINLGNIQQLELNDCVIDATQTALNLKGFTNAVMNDTTITGKNTLIINKLSAVDAKSVNIYASQNAVNLKGASTLNLRDVTVSASKTAIFVDRSAYLCAIESIIKDSEVGLNILNPNIYFNNVILTGNRFALKGKDNPQWLENGLELIDNEVNFIE